MVLADREVVEVGKQLLPVEPKVVLLSHSASEWVSEWSTNNPYYHPKSLTFGFETSIQERGAEGQTWLESTDDTSVSCHCQYRTIGSTKHRILLVVCKVNQEFLGHKWKLQYSIVQYLVLESWSQTAVTGRKAMSALCSITHNTPHTDRRSLHWFYH